jgi:two-component system chemotaxis family response regulator WspR
MVDVDDFKPYNDTYGHLAGDEVLRKVGEAIRNCCERPTDLAARFGGDEFIVCLLGVPSDRAYALGEKLRVAVEAIGIPHKGSSVSTTVTAGIGIAWAKPGRGETYLPLIEAADGALYDAKRSGKNRILLQEQHREVLP